MVGISRPTLNRRMNNPQEFTLGEILLISKFFNTADFVLIVLEMLGKTGKDYLKNIKATT